MGSVGKCEDCWKSRIDGTLGIVVYFEGNPSKKSGADGGGRTHTSVKTQDFESSASANSATSAKMSCGLFPRRKVSMP